MASNWSPRLGEPVGLSLDSDTEYVSVRIVSRPASPARETAVQKFIYTPKLWASTLAGLAVFLLMSTAVASGSIKPAPPPAPTPLPGQPTPTPDTRPRIQLPGFVLEAPVRPAPVAAAAPARGPADGEGAATLQHLELDAQPVQEPPPPPSQACNNLFGIGCGPPPPPKPVAPRPQQRLSQPGVAQAPKPEVGQPPQPEVAQPSELPTTPDGEQPPVAPAQPCSNFLGIGCPSTAPAPPSLTGPELVVPVPSPGPGGDARDRALGLRPPGPPAGSNLDDALRAASIATQNFNTGLSSGSATGSEHADSR